MAKRKRPNIMMCLAFVLLCLTLLTTHFTGGLYAKYVAKDSAEDSARVIKFGDLRLTETGDFVDGKAVVVPGVDLIKNVTVEFDGSESATYVFMKATLFPGDWGFSVDNKMFTRGTEWLKWKVQTEWSYLKSINNSNNSVDYIFYIELEPNKNLSIPFIADGGKITVNQKIEKQAVVNMGSLKIDLKAYVVQSGGFADADAAWKSVNK